MSMSTYIADEMMAINPKIIREEEPIPTRNCLPVDPQWTYAIRVLKKKSILLFGRKGSIDHHQTIFHGHFRRGRGRPPKCSIRNPQC